MEVKSILVKELSLRVKILVPSKKELQDDLASVVPTVSELEFRSWVLESFVIGITTIFSTIEIYSEGDPSLILKYRELLYKYVLRLNPNLNPDNIYVSPSNVISLETGPSQIKITEYQ